MNSVKWNLINTSTIDKKSGLYAWYYDLSIGDHDIKKLIELLESNINISDNYKSVSDFLEKNFFIFFKEDNYKTKITGKLMPTFVGDLLHVEQCSESLVNKIVNSPTVLWDIKKIINEISVGFSSPIYIGMSENLQSRINNHKRLIEKFKNERIRIDNFDDRDENFAARIISRGMIETNLRVVVKYVSSDKNIHNLMENLLNRVNYPILGRN